MRTNSSSGSLSPIRSLAQHVRHQLREGLLKMSQRLPHGQIPLAGGGQFLQQKSAPVLGKAVGQNRVDHRPDLCPKSIRQLIATGQFVQEPIGAAHRRPPLQHRTGGSGDPPVLLARKRYPAIDTRAGDFCNDSCPSRLNFAPNRYHQAMFTRELIEARERRTLAPYALFSGDTRGRSHVEQDDPFRTDYQRDRDRVIHSTAFRRLEYKTQVFVYHEGDYYRTRLTHSIEVSQIARSVANALGLNESFVEALSLAHDLGHPPFGHAGGNVLHGRMADHGGFEHNVHGLRIVDLLERRYAGFDGLNLTYEIREAILKHGPAGSDAETSEFPCRPAPLLETCVVDLADSTAYHHHDMDDGLRSGILNLEALAEASSLVARSLSDSRETCPDGSARQLRMLTINGVVKRSILDLIRTSAERLRDPSIRSAEDARGVRGLISYSDEMAGCHRELHRFLFQNFYRHHRVTRMMDKAGRLLGALFDAYTDRPELLPPEFQRWAEREGIQRAVCDYIAGMTDRYAEQDYQKLFDPTVRA